jgi:hypothetical protein
MGSRQVCIYLYRKKGVSRMAKEKEPKRIDISSMPDLVQLANKVRETNKPLLLQQEGEDLAMLTPIKPVAKRRVRGKPTTADDPLWKLIGIGHFGKGDVSANKHKYLAEAYLPRKQA